MKQKLFALLLTLAAVFTLLTFSASAADVVDSGAAGDLTWTLDNVGVLTISGAGAMPDYSNLTDRPWHSLRSSVKSVVVEPGVTTVGQSVFQSLTKLETVELPAGLTMIGASAFSGCARLTAIQIPDTVTRIGSNAFQDCILLESVTIPDGVTYIDSYAFQNCSSLTSVMIPDSVTYIEKYAFYGCSSLTCVTIPDSVIYIGSYTFQDCSSLTSVTIPDSVTSIGSYTFQNCSSLTGVTIPNGVTSIGRYTFYHCSSLTNVTIPNSVTRIAYGAFNGCSSLTSVTIPDSVTSIESSAFAYCSSLTSVTIPDSVTSIPGYTFDDCASLTSVTIPDSVTSIGSNAFYGCSSLQDVYYTGLKAQWEKISIDNNNNPLLNATIHYDACVPAEIVTDPADVAGQTGETATFTVKATGGMLTYRWEYSDDGGETWESAGSERNTVTCEIAAELDGRLYRCVVTDGNGDSVTSAAAKLSYIATPVQIKCSPADAIGKPGTVAAFTVIAQGEGLTYAWEYSDDDGATWNQSTNISFVATCKITAARNGRLYRCTVTDQYGNSVQSESGMVICRSTLAITAQPQDYTGAVGEKAIFTIAATGDGLKYQWQYSDNGGKSWKDSSAVTESAACGVTAARSGRLYRCIVTDQLGNQLTSDAAKLSVLLDTLAITAQPEDDTGVIGDKAVFTVTATGTGLTYLWEYSDDGGATWTRSNSTAATATCGITTARDGRLYRCTVTDASGASVTSAAAKVIVQPTLQITAQPEDYTGAVGTNAAFTVAATGAGLKYQWYYSDNDGASWTKSSSTTDTATCLIKAARDGRLYRCVITAANGEKITSESAKVIVG